MICEIEQLISAMQRKWLCIDVYHKQSYNC